MRRGCLPRIGGSSNYPGFPNSELFPMTTIWLALFLYWAPRPAVQFSRADARLLVKNAPGVSELSDRCVSLREIKWPDDDAVLLFNVDNSCMKNTVTRTVGLYFVNLRTGNVY